jgi:hypothetical protein
VRVGEAGRDGNAIVAVVVLVLVAVCNCMLPRALAREWTWTLELGCNDPPAANAPSSVRSKKWREFLLRIIEKARRIGR